MANMLWYVHPLIFIIATWLLVYQPSLFTDRCPAMLKKLNTYNNNNNDNNNNNNNNNNKQGYGTQQPSLVMLVKIPEVPEDIYRLGQLSESLKRDPSQTLIFQEFSSIAGTNITTMSDVHEYYEKVIKIQGSQQTLLKRLAGIDWVTTLLWIISIVGIFITFLPFIHMISKSFYGVFLRIMMLVVDLFIRGFLEPIPYVICFGFIVLGEFFNKEVGFFIGLTGAIGFAFFWSYTAIGRLDISMDSYVLYSVMLLVWMPLSVHYGSRFLGFFTIVSLYSAIGVTGTCGNLMWSFGFKSDGAVQRGIFLSVLIIPTFLAVTLSHVLDAKVEQRFLQPFSLGITCYATIAYLTALLIISHYIPSYRSSSLYNPDDYASNNIWMIISLVGFALVGSVFGVDSLLNTALTFGFLYVSDKLVEISDNTSGSLFIIFIMMFLASFYIKTHPGFFIQMFDSSGVMFQAR